jgi:hypothetical protein
MDGASQSLVPAIVAFDFVLDLFVLEFHVQVESIVASIGLFATTGCEPRQVRKEATVVTDACVEGGLMLATIGFKSCDSVSAQNFSRHQN